MLAVTQSSSIYIQSLIVYFKIIYRLIPRRCNYIGRLVAIGDIHGCFYTLQELLKSIQYNDAEDILIFLGDLIDRGKHSYDVVQFVYHCQKQSRDTNHIVVIRGNHEQMAIDAFEQDYTPEDHALYAFGDATSLWYLNGGQSTVLGFYKHSRIDLLRKVNWFRSFPIYYETDSFIFCHAGLTHPVLRDNSTEDLLWGRQWIETDNRPREKQVVFGHTPNPRGPFKTKTGDICIDAGCVFGGNLCALIVTEDGEKKLVWIPQMDKDK